MLSLVLATVLAVTIPPAPRDFIADQAGILTDQRDIRIMQAGAQIKGVNLGVLTINELDDEPRAVAIRTLNYWSMTPDSVLLLISMNPRKVYLQPGSNYAGIFSEEVATGITRGMVPYMKRRDFSGAVAYAFVRIEERLPERAAPKTIPGLAPDPVSVPVPDKATSRSSFLTTLLVFFAMSGLIGAVIFLVQRFKRRQERERDKYEMQLSATKRKLMDAFVETVPTPQAGVHGVGGGSTNNSFVTGLLVGNALSNNQPREVVHYDYSRPAPPPAPAYEPPSHSRSFDYGSSSSDSGGGGSDWGSSGGGFDSGGGGGGGGSDW